MNVTLLILHYADSEITNICVRSIYPQATAIGARLVVVDNGSPTPYVPDHSKLDVMRLEQNLFMIPAFALAMRAYPADVYGLLNNDLVCYPGMLNTVLGCFDDPNVGLVAPGSSDTHTGVLFMPVPCSAPNVEVDQVDNHCIFLSQALIDELGYPEVTGHTHRACWAWNRYICWTARQAGFKVIAARRAYVEHRHVSGYSEAADDAGRKWLQERLGEHFAEAW